MISRQAKAAFYASMALPLRVSGWVYRSFFAPRHGVVKVHLGPGQGKYFVGWKNVDANFFSAKIDVWADLRNKLPFRDNSVDAFYSHHVIEHLPDTDLQSHFCEMFRCLKPEGIIRVGGPNGDSAARKLLEGDAAWFSDFPVKRQSVGGRYANFLMCKGEHLTVLTLSYLKELCSAAGFVDVQPCQPIVQTFHPALIDATVLDREYEATPAAPHTLLIEARKPGPAAVSKNEAQSVLAMQTSGTRIPE
jgi:predicted SAM-dependent methyltransferase